jgi:hypothetical protein
VTDRILGGRLELPVRHRVPVGYEQRIVAEAILTRRTDSDPAMHLTKPDMFSTIWKHQSHSADKPCRPLRCSDIGKLAQQQCIVLLVAGVGPGPACRTYAGHLVEHVNGQARIIGQRGQARGRDTSMGLEQRVALEGALRFGRLRIRGDISKSKDLHIGSRLCNDAPQLGQLLGVVRRQHHSVAD